MRLARLTVACLILALSSATRCVATPISYPDFSNTAGLSLNGDAFQFGSAGSTVVRLAKEARYAGTFFTTSRLGIQSFSTEFRFRITSAGGLGVDGADGLTFSVQSARPDIVGRGGGWLGYAMGTSGEITPSVAIEFDTFENPDFADPDSNHLGVLLNASTIHSPSLPVVPIGQNFDDGNVWYAWIDYDGRDLEVRANQSGVRPSLPELRYSIDIPGILNATSGYVGFTAGTAQGWGNHDILSWRYESANIVPEPSSIAVWSLLSIISYCSSRRRSRFTSRDNSRSTQWIQSGNGISVKVSGNESNTFDTFSHS